MMTKPKSEQLTPEGAAKREADRKAAAEFQNLLLESIRQSYIAFGGLPRGGLTLEFPVAMRESYWVWRWMEERYRMGPVPADTAWGHTLVWVP